MYGRTIFHDLCGFYTPAFFPKTAFFPFHDTFFSYWIYPRTIGPVSSALLTITAQFTCPIDLLASRTFDNAASLDTCRFFHSSIHPLARTRFSISPSEYYYYPWLASTIPTATIILINISVLELIDSKIYFIRYHLRYLGPWLPIPLLNEGEESSIQEAQDVEVRQMHQMRRPAQRQE